MPKSKNVTRRSHQRSIYWSRNSPGTIYTLVNNSQEITLPGFVSPKSDAHWKVKVSKQQDATNAYEVYGYYGVIPADVTARTSMRVAPFYDSINRSHGDLSTSLKPSSFPEDTALRDIALSRLKRKLNAESHSYNAILPLAELKDMRRTLRGAANMSSLFVGGLLTLRNKGGNSLFQRVSDSWLTYSFGIKPLVNEVKEAATAIDYALNGAGRCVRVGGTASKSWQSGYDSKGSTGAYNGPLCHTSNRTHSLSYRYTAGVNLVVNSSNDYSVMSQLGFTSENLIPTFWELVPYSWLVDYFTTAGNYFEDVFTSPPGSTYFCSLSSMYRTTNSAKHYHITANPSTTDLVVNDTDVALSNFYWFKRSKLSTIPTRALRFRTVDEIGANAVSKLLNLTALLGVRKRR